MEFPAGLRVFQIGEDFDLGLWTDEFDVERVRLHALTPGMGGR